MLNSRAQIRLDTSKDVRDLVQILNSDGTADKYIITNFNGSYIVDARSLLGVMYASAEFGDGVFISNLTEDGKYPSGIDRFRV